MTRTVKRKTDIEFVEGDECARITFRACIRSGRPHLSIEVGEFLPVLSAREVRAFRDWLTDWLRKLAQGRLKNDE